LFVCKQKINGFSLIIFRVNIGQPSLLLLKEILSFFMRN